MTDNGRITWTNEIRKLSDLIPWPRNPRQVKVDQVKRLQESLDEFGQPETIAIGPGNELYNGHQRLKSWADKYGDIDVDVRVSSRALTEKEREKLTVFLHKGAAGEWDFDVLANEFELDDLLDWGFEKNDLELDLWGEDEPESEPAEGWYFDSSNKYGIPDLLLEKQLTNITNLEKWGVKSRRAKHDGVYHFFTEDSKFNSLWDKPYQIPATGCNGVIEVNYTTYENDPLALVLADIFKKRWLSRYWQEQGVNIAVDLCVEPKFYEWALIGVPKGWMSYCTRAYSDRLDEVLMEYELAKTHAEENKIVFYIYGGGKDAQKMASEIDAFWFDDWTIDIG